MTGRIVVGVDDTNGSRNAIRWALLEAELRNDTVEAIHVWVEDAAFDEVNAKVMVTRLISEIQAEIGATVDPTVTAVVGETPRHVLIEASVGADLLVLGAKDHGRVVDRMLGSVSGACVHHAHCPVVVVRT